MLLGLLCRGWANNRNENPAFLQRLPRTLLRLAADGIEHNVHVMHHILKSCLLVIDGFVHSQLPQKRLIPGWMLSQSRTLPSTSRVVPQSPPRLRLRHESILFGLSSAQQFRIAPATRSPPRQESWRRGHGQSTLV